MSAITPWEPFRELSTVRNRMSQLFDDAWPYPFRSWMQPLDELTPPLDIVEEEGAYIVKASLPGVPPEAAEVTVADNVLTIKGEAKEDKEINKENYRMRERHYGSFMRCITLPAGVEADKVEASSENGVLTLRLPKSEVTKPTKITIKPTKGNSKK